MLPLHTSSSSSSLTGSYESLRTLSDYVVAYHICQADNNITCMVPEFVHSLAAYLASAPRLAVYRDHLLQEPHLQSALTIQGCVADPSKAFVKGVLEPLTELKQTGRLGLAPCDVCVILIDSLNEAEFHKPDYGDTISSFLGRHVMRFPPWLKIVATVRSSLVDVTQLMPFYTISLDGSSYSSSGESNLVSNNHQECNNAVSSDCPHIQQYTHQDLYEYIAYRINSTAEIRNNLTLNDLHQTDLEFQARFIGHVQALSKGSFLYCKLLLDLIQRGSLVLKSANFKILPVNLTEIFLLLFNLKFPTIRSFEKVLPILNICLASLYPLTAKEIYECVNSAFVHTFMDYHDFMRRINMLQVYYFIRLLEINSLFPLSSLPPHLN